MEITKKMLVAVILFIILLFAMLPITSFASNTNFIIVDKKDNNYAIYLRETLNSSFEFAFSKEQNTKDLNYINSAQDSNGNQVAYIDQELKSKFFDSESTYIWVRQQNKEIISGEKIELKEAKNIETISQIQNITKRITVKTNAEDEKIKINGKQGIKYYYEIKPINFSESYKELAETIEEISNFDDHTNYYLKLDTYSKLNDLYNQLVPNHKDENWIEVKNLEITKPYEAKENQKYLLWIKDEKGTVDVQILTAYVKQITKVENKEVAKQTITNLPVTYDNTTILFIALGIVIIAIITILIVKRIKQKANHEK